MAYLRWSTLSNPNLLTSEDPKRPGSYLLPGLFLDFPLTLPLSPQGRGWGEGLESKDFVAGFTGLGGV